MVVLDSINTTLATLNADVNQMLGKASREQLLPVYSEAKSLVCCMMPDAAASMWMGLTFAGEGWHYSVLQCVASALGACADETSQTGICCAASFSRMSDSGWVH
jgi:hypothetical protein